MDASISKTDTSERPVITKQLRKLLNADIREFMKKNDELDDHQCAKLFRWSYRGVDYITNENRLSYKKFQRERRKITKSEEQYDVSQDELDSWEFPKRLYQKNWIEGYGFSKLPKLFNEPLLQVTFKQRQEYAREIINIYNGCGKINPHLWKNNIDAIWNYINTRFQSHGISKKNKTRAYKVVIVLRFFLRYWGWSVREIEDNFPAVLKDDPLIDRVADEMQLCFTDEEEEIYRTLTFETMNELIQKGVIEVVAGKGIIFWINFALDTGTRIGIGHDFNKSKTEDWGRGIAGIRIKNIFFDDPYPGYCRIYLHDKYYQFWDKYCQRQTTIYLKDYLEELIKYYGENEKMLYPSNDGLEAMKKEKIYDSKLFLWSESVINELLEKINWRFWGKVKKPKGNPNLVKEGGCLVVIRTHFFRHHVAMKAVREGIESLVACKLLGWSDPNTYNRCYAKVQKEVKLSTMSRMFKDDKLKAELKKEGRYIENTAQLFK